MSLVLRNIAANAVGQGGTTLLSLLLIPWYVRFLGVEAWGLAGIYAVLQSLSAVLDMGLSTTALREAARSGAQGDTRGSLRPLVRSLEKLYWPGVGGLALAAWGLAGPAVGWFKLESLPHETVRDSLRLMAVAVLVQLPSNLYFGILSGLQRQMAVNALLLAGAVARGAGTLAVLAWVSPTPEAFFLCQAAASLAVTVAAVALCRARLPAEAGEAPRVASLLGGFAAGMMGNTLLWMLLLQADKIVLSRILPMTAFGHYALASTLAAGLYRLFSPVGGALLPRLCELAARGSDAGLRRAYRGGAQATALVVVPAAAAMAIFAPEVMSVWLRDQEAARASAPYLRVTSVAMGFFCLANVPYLLLVALGRVRFLFVNNIVLLVAACAASWAAFRTIGVSSAAFLPGWVAAGYAVFTVPWIHRDILPGETAWWWWTGLFLPCVSSVGAAGLWAWFSAGEGAMARLTGGSAAALAAAAVSLPVVRERVWRWRRPGEVSR